MNELGSVFMVLCCGGYLLLTIDSEYSTISFGSIRFHLNYIPNEYVIVDQFFVQRNKLTGATEAVECRFWDSLYREIRLTRVSYGCLFTSFCFFFSLFPLTGVFGQNCGRNSKQCTSGGCVRSSEMCDGVVNCADGSDETAIACITTDCPRYSFRCAYGACVGQTAECNGVRVSENRLKKLFLFLAMNDQFLFFFV